MAAPWAVERNASTSSTLAHAVDRETSIVCGRRKEGAQVAGMLDQRRDDLFGQAINRGAVVVAGIDRRDGQTSRQPGPPDIDKRDGLGSAVRPWHRP